MRPNDPSRVRGIAAALLLGALGATSGAAAAPDTPPPASAEKSWFATQLRRFSNYPHLERAYRLLKAERLAEARHEFDIAVRTDPDDTDARISYALLLYRLRAYEQCAAELDRVLQQRPGHVPARLNRALARTALEQLDPAMDDLRRVAESPGVDRQDWLLARNMIAELATRRQRPADALAALDDLVRDGAPDADLLFRRGVANEASGRPRQAEDDFRQSLALARTPSQRQRAHEAIARSAQARGDAAAVQANLAAALQFDPHNLSLLRALAQASADQGLHDQAIQWARLALARRSDPQDRRMLAELLMHTGNYQDAARQYVQLAAAPGDSAQQFHVHMSLGYAYSNVGRWLEAADAFGHAADLKPDATALQAQATALESAGRPARAIEPLVRLRSVQPAQAEIDLRLGALYARTGDAAAALRHLDQATRAGVPTATRAAAHRQRGQLLYSQGAYAAARQAQERAVDLLPKDAALYAALAETCLKLGAYRDAVGYLQRGVGVRRTSERMSALTRAFRKAQNWDAGIEAGLALLDVPGLTPAQRAEALEDLGIAYYQSGKRELAVEALQRAFDGGRAGWQARQILGLALFDLKRFDAALPHFRASVEQHRTAQGLAYVARAYHALHKPGLSVHYLELALADRGALEPALEKQLYDELGYLLSDAAEYTRAAEAFDRSLALGFRADTALRLARMQRLSGRPDQAESLLGGVALDGLDSSLQVSIHDERAQALALQRRHREAIDALSQANALQPTAERAYEIGLHFLQLDQPQAAIPPLEAAVAQAPEHARYAQTLGHAHGLAGQPERAESALRAIAPDKLDAPARVLVQDQLAHSQAAQGRHAEALESLSQADALEPTAERRYRIGLLQLELGQLQAAVASLEAALDRQPDQVQYAETLGYAYNRGGRYGDAARMMERVLASDPDREVLYREIGYMHMRNLDNDAAIRWFKRGIDHRASRLAEGRRQASASPESVLRRAADGHLQDEGVRPGPGLRHVGLREADGASRPSRPVAQAIDAPAPRTIGTPSSTMPDPARPAPGENDAVIRQMRQEVAKLSNRFDATFYQSYRADSARQAAVASPSTGGVIPSQGGMELAYQPPVIGFRDERVLQVYARALWGNRAASLAIERETAQGGVGVRYKPLKTHQLYVSAERLFRIGDRSEDNWLLRASYGWQNGIDIPPDRDSWNYTTLYVDVGYFAATPRRRALYAEARQGRSFKVGDAWSVTPHLVLNGRDENPAPSQASYLEGGVGVSLRYQFDESRYETYRSSLELLLQYKRGIVHGGSGWVMTAIARF